MKLRNSIIVAALALFAAPVFAGPSTVELSDFTGQWFNGVTDPPGGVTIIPPPAGSNPTTARWGTPAVASQSGYDYTSVAGPLDFIVNPPPEAAAQIIGTFNHLNFPIFAPNLLTIELAVDANVSVDGGPTSPQHFVFDFTHDETPNGGPPGGPFTGSCPFGGPNGSGVNSAGCADRVTVAGNGALSSTFMVGGVSYTLELLGFSNDGGGTFTSEFLTTENQQNAANLYARVSAVTPSVPEPGSLALLGLGLLAAGFMRRKLNR